MRMKTTSYYFRIITFVLILSTVPVIIVGLFSYLKSSEIIQANVAKEKQQSMYQIQTNVEQILKTVDHSLSNYVTSFQLNQTLKEPLTPLHFQLINQVKKELNYLQRFDTGIEDIVLVSLQHDWLINNNGYGRLTKKHVDSISDYMNLPTKSSWLLEERNNIIFNSDLKNTCPYYINLVKKLPLDSSYKTGLAVANIPTCELTPFIASNIDIESIIILDEDLNVVGHSDKSFIGQDFSEVEYINSLDNSKRAGQFNTAINNTNFKVTFRKSEYNDWTYLSVIKISDLYKQSNAIGWFTFFICAALLILSLIVSYFGSQRIYKPIQQLKELIQTSISTKHSEITHQDDFKLIKNQIQHMIVQNDQLEKQLQGQIGQLRQFFILNLVQGKVSTDEIPIKLASFGLSQNWKKLCVFTLQIDSLEGTTFEKKEEDLLLFAINTMVDGLLPTEQKLTPTVLNRSQVTIILSEHSDDEKYNYEITQLAQTIQSSVKEELNIPISIGISLPFSDLSLTHYAYKEGLEALKYRLKFGTESIIFYENLERGGSFHTFFPKQIENELFDAIKVCDKSIVSEKLEVLLQSIFEKDLNHTQYQISITRFFYDLLELMQMLGVDIIEIDDGRISLFDQLYELKTFEEVQNWFSYKIIYPLLSKIEERTESQYKSLSDKIIHIVQQEYDSDLTLESIAARLHYNPNYLSSIFRKETNISFSEYLALYRLNIAKKWLIETDMSVKEISERLMYNNSQNFIRSFRKTEGTTPGKYRTIKKAE
ncbi:helix-turn-helix domain-containing protein [Halalkalibacter urbisdiaboli]|uniref:helix-turn-helix domain-containing protein n=1 Tax=Halalkalibacter urbisdiaboli TaxID=1960589 RepID=UPI000B43813D|nr:helix-turn-helix domain-containing protein [Halalkalibacter urbisdiaboli]